MDTITQRPTKYIVQVAKKDGWVGVKSTSDRTRALHAEGTYITLGYLTRIKSKVLA
jgi:hypothetical protein